MKCDRCNAEATVHEVMIRQGQHAERHLCERCAAKLGLFGKRNPSAALKPSKGPKPPTAGDAPIEPPKPTHSFSITPVSKLPGPSSGTAPVPALGPPAPARAGTCRGCGITMASFRQDERLGCPRCYDELGETLAGLIERVHDGASCHVGKIPKRLLAEARIRAATPGVTPDARASIALTSSSPAASSSTPASSTPGASALPALTIEVSARRKSLREQLARAVELEQYEQAAKLRDELARLDRLLSTTIVQPAPDAKRRLEGTP